ncbi:Cytochrome C OS=Bosea thiooxidans OX=53254 GN=ARD30_15240 PE=4 SV=1 [Bosea thiooxidans]
MSRSARPLLFAGLLATAMLAAGPLRGQGKPAPKPAAPAAGAAAAQPKKLGLGREALQEIKAWDIDVRPDGHGLPPGKGTVKQGDEIFQTQCASCHGEFGQGNGRWPVLASRQGSLTSDRPEKAIGSFWPDLSTVFDYVHRAMPYGNAQSLTPDDLRAHRLSPLPQRHREGRGIRSPTRTSPA